MAEEMDPRTGPQGLEAFEGDLSLPYLGTPSVVDQLVRSFATEVIEANSAFECGKANGEEAHGKIAAAVKRYAGIFEGRDDGYRPMPHVNTPTGLGRLINDRFGFTEGPEVAVEHVLWLMVKQVIGAADRMAAGTISDDAARFHVEAAVDDAVSAFLGMPADVSVSDDRGIA